MSNDTQVQAHMALVDDYALWGRTPFKAEARAKVEASTRQLSEQPGFVMVPTDEELTAIYKRANGEDVGKAQPLTTQRIFKAMRAMIQARPLTASPTAPSTEASEPVGDGTLCGHCDGSGTVLAVTGHLGPDDYEYEAQCEACWGTGSSDLSDAINALSYQPHSVTPGRQMVHRADVLRIIAARTTPPPAPVLSDAWNTELGQRCPHCDGTGDVHSIDGEWRGRCYCPEGQANPGGRASRGAK